MRATMVASLVTSLVIGTALMFGSAANAAPEWWMVQQTEQGRECAEPIELEGERLTPDVLMRHHRECKLMDDTPSLDLETVMVTCAGDIGRVFIFTRSRAACERLVAD